MTFHLDLSEPQIEFHTNPQDLLQGGDYNFLCISLTNLPSNDISYQWYFNGKLIQTNRQLKFDNVTAKDSGNYQCVVKNQLAEKNVTMLVKVKGMLSYAIT